MRILIMKMVTNPARPSTNSAPLRGLVPPGAQFSSKYGILGPTVCNALSDRLEIRIVLQNVSIKISHLQPVRVGTWI
jgi:hypothetical protein